jgi:hypothetical protein
MTIETIINTALLGIPAAFAIWFLGMTVRKGY